ncbi:MAG: YicC family protein [Candidatus Omnitrophica bacterium]|nr:YicC family protein [Candidatus Omnitrophota bacterium]
MIRSMTAFARVSETTRTGGGVVEIRSLNNRYLDLSLRLMPSLIPYEIEIRELIQSQIRRGKVSVSISQEVPEEDAQEMELDEVAVERYMEAIRKLQKKYKLENHLTLSDLIRIPGIFKLKKDSKDSDKVWGQMKKLLRKGLEKALESKKEEGRKLCLDVNTRLSLVAKSVQQIEGIAHGRSEQIAKRLKERIDVILKEHPIENDDRFFREVAFLAEKSDVTEEIVRMKSHLELFESRLKSNGEVGRELDFLCQEMNREMNTIGSKSQHFDITTDVVFVKGELEKIREQIQNIE